MPTAWRFHAVSLRRVRITRNLQEELGVNMPGAALALDLLDELERLRALAPPGGLRPVKIQPFRSLFRVFYLTNSTNLVGVQFSSICRIACLKSLRLKL